MPRQSGGGLKYWSFDVGFFRDKKIRKIKGEFGLKGVMIFIYILNAIYEKDGYYMKWEKDDDCYFMSDDVGDGCSPDLIEDVVHRCVKRSLFDERIFNMFGVLTSASIQRRFLISVANNRNAIPFVQEYWLLDKDNPNDVSDSVLKKLVFISQNRKENGQNLKENPESLKGNTTNKTKENKSKVNKNKEDILHSAADAATVQDNSPVVAKIPLNDKSIFEVRQSKADHYKELYPAVDISQELRSMQGWSESNPTKRKTRKGIEKFINSWLRRVQDTGRGYAPKRTEQPEPSYDISEYMKKSISIKYPQGGDP